MTDADDSRTQPGANRKSVSNKRARDAHSRNDDAPRDELDPKVYGCRDADELFGTSASAHEPSASNCYGQAYAAIAHHDEEHAHPHPEDESLADEESSGGSFNPGDPPGKRRVYDWYSIADRVATNRARGGNALGGRSAREVSRIDIGADAGPVAVRSLRDQVRERLYGHVGIDVGAIDIVTDKSDVTLIGKVGSQLAKRMAENCAASVRGVGKITNRLTIDRNIILPDED